MDAKQYNGWQFVIGQNFNEFIILRDPSKPKIINPDWTKCQPIAGRDIYPPFDLTGHTGRMDIRAEPSHTSQLLKTLSTGLGITFGSPNPVDGSVGFYIDDSEIKAAPFTDFIGKKVYYDFFLINPAGNDPRKIIYGSIPVLDSVTNV